MIKLVIQIIIPISFLFLFHSNSSAQVAVFGGGNYCTLRNDVLLKNKKPIIASEFGLSIQYHPIKGFEKLSVINEMGISQKGYQQNLIRNYTFKFNYLAFPVLIDYKLIKPLSVQGGVELSKLFSTHMEDGTNTYNNFDAGLVLGLGWRQGRILSFYLRGIYGLVPMLDYYTFDELGNITGKIHDLKNMCVSAGIKINLFNEKFRSYK